MPPVALATDSGSNRRQALPSRLGRRTLPPERARAPRVPGFRAEECERCGARRLARVCSGSTRRVQRTARLGEENGHEPRHAWTEQPGDCQESSCLELTAGFGALLLVASARDASEVRSA